MTDPLVHRLVARLRRRGVAISVAEVLDAHRALAAVGVAAPRRARTALRATLVKQGADVPAFDDEFDALLAELGDDELARPGASEAAPAVAFDGVAASIDQLPEDAERLTVDDARDVPAEAGALELADGGPTGEHAGIDGVELADAGARAGDDRMWHRLRSAREPLEGNELAPLERRAIERAARSFVRAHRDDARRWSRAVSGRLDVRATMRAARRTDGVPMRLLRRGRTRRAPRLIVLADVSISVRPTAVLALHTADALTRCSRGVRLLVFVDRAIDATSLVRRMTPGAAVAALLHGDVVDLGAASDYGLALRTASDRVGGWLGPRTTVLVFGDGRSNGADPGYGLVERWMRRVSAVHWCSPEPVAAWPLGFGEMQGYADRVTVARQVRTVDDVLGVLGG